MENDDIYYRKYLKYKAKYLALKYQEGGLAMPEFLKTKSRKEKELLEKKLRERDIKMVTFTNQLIKSETERSPYKEKMEIIKRIDIEKDRLYNIFSNIRSSVNDIKAQSKIVYDLIRKLGRDSVNPNNYGRYEPAVQQLLNDANRFVSIEENLINKEILQNNKQHIEEYRIRVYNELGLSLK